MHGSCTILGRTPNLTTALVEDLDSGVAVAEGSEELSGTATDAGVIVGGCAALIGDGEVGGGGEGEGKFAVWRDQWLAGGQVLADGKGGWLCSLRCGELNRRVYWLVGLCSRRKMEGAHTFGLAVQMTSEPLFKTSFPSS